MASYYLMSRIVEIGPDEHRVTVSAIPTDMRSAEVCSEVAPTAELAQARRDYLVMSLATEMRARGNEIVGMEE